MPCWWWWARARRPSRWARRWARRLSDALKDGDLAYKAGRCLYLHRLAGVKAPRVVFAAAADASAKAFRAAVLAGLGLIKGGGAKHLLVASALPQPIGGDQAQALARRRRRRSVRVSPHQALGAGGIEARSA